jgi:lipid-binding SYLF domain-containing protein
MKGDKIMKKQALIPPTTILNVFLIAVLFATILSVAGFTQIARAADTAKEIDASVDAALDRFHKQVKGSDEAARNAKGLLIMPNVKKAGLIIGGEYGQGALRIDGKTVGYYKIVSGSVGLQIGVEAKDMILAFMTDEVLNKFRASKGWEAGIDGNIAVISVGAGGAATTRNVNEPIVGYIFDVKGLMGDISLKGAKFSKIDPAQ